MQIPLSKNVALSMMVACLFTSITPSTLGYTSINIYTSSDGYTPTSNMSSSSTSFYVAYASIDCYSTPSTSFDSSMYTRSIKGTIGLACSFELQPLLCLCKNSTIDVSNLYIYLELSYVHIASSQCTFCLLHTLKMMVNMGATLLPMAKCSALQHTLLFSTLLPFFFSTVLLPPPIFVCAHSFVLPSPLLFFIISLSCFPHSCFCEFQNFENTQLSATNENNFRRLFRLFLSLNFPPVPFIF